MRKIFWIKTFLLLALLVASCVIAVHGLGDLPMYYAVSQFAAQGEFQRIYSDNAGVGHFFYAPLSLLFFGWMPLFPYAIVKIIWITLHGCFFVAFWSLLYRLFPTLRRNEYFWRWSLVWLVSIKSIHAGFQSHNIQLMILCGLLFSEWLSRRKNPWFQFIAPIPTVWLALVKVYPAFMVLYLLIVGTRMTRAGIGIALLTGLSVPFLQFGTGPSILLYKTFFTNLFHFHDFAPLTKDAVTLSLASLVATWVSPYWGMGIAHRITQALSLILCGTYFTVLFRYRKEACSRTHLFATGLAIMALVNSSTRPDYFVFFIPGFASLIEVYRKRPVQVGTVIGAILSVLLLCFITEWTLGSRDLNHELELMRLPVLGMILLVGLLWKAFRKLCQPIPSHPY